MAPKKSAAAPAEARVARKASQSGQKRKPAAAKPAAAKPAKAPKVAKAPKAPKAPKPVVLTPTTETETSLMPTEKKSATPVPMKIIKSLQTALVDSGSKKYTQEELKTILDMFWKMIVQELLHGDQHKVSLMNLMTMKLAFRDGQKYKPPKNSMSAKEPKEVTKPPRWHFSVNVKENLKGELEKVFAQQYPDVVSAFARNGEAGSRSAAEGHALIKGRRVAKAK